MSNPAVNPDFDGIWKDALTRWLPDCIELFWPEVHAQIDWQVAPVLLDKELPAAYSTDLFQAKCEKAYLHIYEFYPGAVQSGVGVGAATM